MKYCQFDEEDVLKELVGTIKTKVVCDIGARLKGSNVMMLIEDFGFKGTLVDKNEKHVWELQKHLKGSGIEILFKTVSPEDMDEIVPERCGVLSIDVDGNDYWLWKALTKTPEVVVIECGRDQGALVPEYIPGSPKRAGGAGPDALKALGEEKGYRFYKDSGPNLFFIR